MAADRHHMELQEYMGHVGIESTRQVADHFDIGQTTAVRWLKNENLWVVAHLVGGEYVWQQVYVERILKDRDDES